MSGREDGKENGNLVSTSGGEGFVPKFPRWSRMQPNKVPIFFNDFYRD